MVSMGRVGPLLRGMGQQPHDGQIVSRCRGDKKRERAETRYQERVAVSWEARVPAGSGAKWVNETVESGVEVEAEISSGVGDATRGGCSGGRRI